jgi:hypothetical protein
VTAEAVITGADLEVSRRSPTRPASPGRGGETSVLLDVQFRGLVRPIRRQVVRLLKAGQTCGVAKTAGGCREMLTGYNAS